MASFEMTKQDDGVSAPLNPYQIQNPNYNAQIINDIPNKNMAPNSKNKKSIYSLWLRSSSFLLLV